MGSGASRGKAKQIEINTISVRSSAKYAPGSDHSQGHVSDQTPDQKLQLPQGSLLAVPGSQSDEPVASSPYCRLKNTGNGWAGLFLDLKDDDDKAVPYAPIAGPSSPACEPPNIDGKLSNNLDYAQVRISQPAMRQHHPETVKAAKRLLECCAIREKYVGEAVAARVEPRTVTYMEKEHRSKEMARMLAAIDGDSGLSRLEGRKIVWNPYSGTPPLADPSLGFRMEDGVFIAHRADQSMLNPACIIRVDEFCKDYVKVLTTMRDRDCASFCLPRLNELELKFELYSHCNAALESQRQKLVHGRDWYQIRKVDTHIHHSACFSQKQLIVFIRKKMLEESDTVVAKEGNKELTLGEVFNTAGVEDVFNVNADSLCCAASLGYGGEKDTFNRFDKFNMKYNPFGDKRLRDIFLKTDNYIEGRFLAELTKEVMASYHKLKFVYAEWRISIYGRTKDEWAKLASWFRRNDIQCPQIRWLIQVPRLYPLFRKMGFVTNFGQMIANVFEPLFEASLDPAGHEDVHYLLQQVVGFDSVDDESQSTHLVLKEYPRPEDWNNENNPPYTYWMYFMYANIRSLNALRRARGLNTFMFRPHCGESGNVSHLCSGFMLADSICHGVKLKESPVLQYLYYLAQVGVAVSPLSNDILFIPLQESPFGTFFKRGLNVSLSTDDPLIIHMTEEALVEEYVTAARTFRLSNCDLCEIARNSVLQSGFESEYKDWWIGECGQGIKAHSEAKTNVPAIRLQFRADCHAQEMATLHEITRAETVKR